MTLVAQGIFDKILTNQVFKLASAPALNYWPSAIPPVRGFLRGFRGEFAGVFWGYYNPGNTT
jgi:hypothetical protein